MTRSFALHLRRNAVAYLALFVALGCTGAFAASALVGADGTVNGCVKKAGKRRGTLRVVAPGKACRRSERPIAWNQRGRQGEAGATGATGAAGSPDTPSQVLAKLAQVDGDGSALDSDLLDGHETAFFQRRGTTTGCNAGDRVTGIDANGDVSCAPDLTAPTGPAGGALTGTYPSPQLAQPPVRRLAGTSPCPPESHGLAAPQPIPNNSETVLNYEFPLNAVSWPASGEPCAGVFQRLVAPRAGTYAVSAGLIWSANPTGQRGLAINKNGAPVASSRTAAAPVGDTHSNVATVIRANSGDVFTAVAYQTSGASLDTFGAGDDRNFLGGVWIGP